MPKKKKKSYIKKERERMEIKAILEKADYIFTKWNKNKKKKREKERTKEVSTKQNNNKQ